MFRRSTMVLVVLTLSLAGVVVYQRVRGRMAAQIYRQRLQSLSDSYERLRLTYNEAVKKTAVTELIVDGGRLSVVIRTVEGDRRVVETPFDPYGEVFVDYVVTDGRLWIRRVFDGRTAPENGLVLDPLTDGVDWDGPGVAHGKAVYRRLDEGRWVVTVTGDGSLGLARCADDRDVDLVPSPPVQDYTQIEHDLNGQIERIGVGDILRQLGSLGPGR